jgi:hypothetical protein
MATRNGKKFVYGERTFHLGRSMFDRMKTCEKTGARGMYDLYPKKNWPDDYVLACYLFGERKFFTLFNDPMDFYAFYSALDYENCTFNECIDGARFQKPHFDIDIDIQACDGETMAETSARCSLIAQTALDALIDALREEIPALSVERDIIMCVSDTDCKVSIHLVVDHWYTRDNHESRALYDACIERARLNETLMNLLESSTDRKRGSVLDLTKVIDHAVYSSFQQFRFLFAHKPGKSNTKNFTESWRYRDTVINHVYDVPYFYTEHHKRVSQFLASMVTYVKECSPLANRLSASVHERIAERRARAARASNYGSVPQQLIIHALDRVSTLLGCDAHAAFSVRNSDADRMEITLDRILPTLCPLCSTRENKNVVHSGENPLIRIRKNGVFFACRRARNGSRLAEQYAGEIETSVWSASTQEPARSHQSESDRPKIVEERNIDTFIASTTGARGLSPGKQPKSPFKNDDDSVLDAVIPFRRTRRHERRGVEIAPQLFEEVAEEHLRCTETNREKQQNQHIETRRSLFGEDHILPPEEEKMPVLKIKTKRNMTYFSR